MGDMNPDQDLMHIEAIISSMTLDERENPDKIDRSRRNRIAQGSGSDPSDVNRLLKDFDNMSGIMQKMAGMGMRDRMKAINELKDMGAMDPNASMNKKKERSKRGPVDRNTIREKRKKERKNARNARKKNKRKR
jgi:signal recognition particle subunit SRP54